MTQTIDLAEIIDASKVSRFQIRIVLLCALAMFTDGFDVQSVSFVAPVLASEWDVAKSAFGPVFSAGLLGLALGGMLFGALADRFGRKKTIIVCLSLFGVVTLAKVMAGSVTSLLVLQFVAGIGLGGVMPNAFALTAEYAPRRRRALMITIAASSYSMGVACAGLLAGKLIGSYGWQSMFYVGGVVPLVVVPIIIIGLPESIRFLILYPGRSPRAEQILRRIAPDLPSASELRLILPERKQQGIPVKSLLTEGRAATTLLLWLTMFMNLSIIYFVISWLPMILHGAGFSLQDASLSAALFPVAGIVGGPAIGRLMDRFGTFRILPLVYGVAAISVLLIGSVASISFGVFCLVTSAAGFCAVGGDNGLKSMASELYPTSMRATGVGWAIGVGRLCSMASPALGGLLIAWQWSGSAIFSVVAIPACCNIATILCIKALNSPEKVRDVLTPRPTLEMGGVGEP
jgi:AAHS family 4-hydroxybenzoate transporter-like MFS transporter